MARLILFLTALAAMNAALWGVVLLAPSTINDPNEYASWRYVRAFGASRPTSLVLGDSRARAGINVGLLGEQWRNLALGGATPVEVKYLFDNRADAWGEIDAVIIGFGGLHFERQDTFERRALQYNQLRTGQILEVRRRAAELLDRGGREFLGASDAWPAYVLRLWPPVAAEIRQGWLENALTNPLHPFTVMRARYEDYLAVYEASGGWEGRLRSISDQPERRLPSEEGEAALAPNALILEYLDALVAQAAGRARLVVLASPPYSSLTARNAMSAAYWAGVEEVMCAAARPHANVEVMPVTIMNERFYDDQDHLNVEGARLWTAEIAAFLEAPASVCGSVEER